MANTVSHKENSKRLWSIKEGDTPSTEQMKFGCLQRIADATEAMAKNHVKLQQDYDYMRKDRDEYRDRYQIEKRKSAAYRGQITKLKNQLKK